MRKIEWCDRSDWNPIRGCTRTSGGCRNCYAEAIAARFSGPGQPWHGFAEKTASGPRWTGKVALAPDHILTQPLRWRRPRRVFVNSMGDLFHESVSDEWIDRVFAVMALAPQHTFQILTKRARRMRDYLTSRSALDERGNPAEQIRAAMTALAATPSRREMAPALKAIPLGKYCAKIAWPLPNVWLGVTAEDQQRADERIPDLLMTPAALRWVSVEPMLGAIDLENIRPSEKYEIDALRGFDFDQSSTVARLDWVVCGGESGPHARPMHPSWPRSLRDQCKAASVPFHFKQWGEWSDRVKVLNISRVHAVFDGNNYRVLRNWGDAYQGFRAGDVTVARVGTRRTGWLLDDVEHKGFPGGEHAG